MPSISIPTGTALLAAGGLSAASGLAGAALQSSAANNAAGLQAAAANTAAADTMSMFGTTQANLAPFIQGGTGAFNTLQNLTGTNAGGNPLTAPLTSQAPTQFNPTMAQLAATPGYQFALQQGELATQNSFAAQGLGTSGAAAKGAAQYAEGLASTTYGQQQQQFQQQFQNYLQQNQQIYSMLGGESTLGQNAAATTGTQGLTATGQSGSYLTAGAAAGAAGQVGSANAIAGGLSGIGNSASSTALLLGLNNSGLFGGGTSA